MRLDLRHILDHLDHLPWWKALSLGVSVGVLLAVLGLDLLGGWWGLGIGMAVLGGVVALCWEVEPLLVLEATEEVGEKPGKAHRSEEVIQKTVSVTDHWGLEFRDSVSSTSNFDAQVSMVEIPGGTFSRGGHFPHEVTVSTFALSKTIVTRNFYRKLMESYPQEWDRDEDDDQLPANYIDWFDAVDFCNRLSERSGLIPCYEIDGDEVTWYREANGYRLPTEAEWEWACRAGTTTEFFWGDDEAGAGEYAWYKDNADNRVHPVAGKKPNPWDLYDMAGNVSEWCWDWHGVYPYPADPQIDPIGPSHGVDRVLRGSNFISDSSFLLSAERTGNQPGFRSQYIGFRIARSPAQS